MNLAPNRLIHAARAAALATLLTMLPALTGCFQESGSFRQLVGTEPAHVRVIWTNDPQTEAQIAWSTGEAGSDHRVRFDLVSRAPDAAEHAESVTAGLNGQYAQFGGDQPQLFFHQARLRGLSPATTYWFVVESDGERSREFYFRTAPADDRPITILAGGDSRTQRSRRRDMNRRIAKLVEADPEILALAHGGDYVWAGHELDDMARWLDDHELCLTEDGRILPLIPTRGNHETNGRLFDQVFGWPGGGLGKNYFGTRLSSEVLLITLNTEIATGGDQAAFLERSLLEGRDLRWKVAQYHSALWPAYKAPAPAKHHWVPLFEAHGLDLAMESDGHVLKRTPPIRDEQVQPGGVVYIGEGGFGVKQRRPKSNRWYLQPPGVAFKAYHVWKLRFEKDRLELDAILHDGSVGDHSLLRPRCGD